MAIATATATVTPVLTPSQQAAREFWRQAGADGMPPFYIMSQYYAQLNANSDDLPAVTAALNQLLTGLGYETDVDTVFSELNAGQGEELGYWAGRYCLFDSDANRFDLVVGRNGATLIVPPTLVDPTKLPAGTDLASVTVLSGASFSDGVLQLANAQFQVSLRFTLPVSDASLDADNPFQATAPQCTGTFVVLHPWWQRWGFVPSSRPVNGKRGAWTQAGVNQTADGDPAAAWYGQYVLLNVTDVTAVKLDPNPVYLYNDPNFGLTFQWGDDNNAKYGGNVTYNNNVLQCPDDDDPDTNYAMQFIAPQAGAAEINLTVTTQGVVSSYKGYWVDRYTQPSSASQASSSSATQGRLAKRPMTAAYRAAAMGASGSGYSQAIDVGSLSTDKPNTITLPYGAVGNDYALSLNLTNCAAVDEFSWTLTPGGGGDDATNRAVITPSGATEAQFTLANFSDSDAGQQLLVTAQLTNNSPASPVSYTLQFDIKVIQCDAISLAPKVLMPVVVGTAYTQNLVAHGAHGNFTWSDPNSDPNTSLPPGLIWDPSSQQLSGTVTDAGQVGKAFSLVVQLAASDVLMDPLKVSLGISVQSAPVVASDMPPWETIFIYAMSASGLVILALGVFAYNRYKAAKANAKTADSVEKANTNVQNATNGDPNSVSKSIVQTDNAKLPTVEGNIPIRQSLLNDINQQVKELNTQLEKNEATMTDMRKYLEEHKRDKWDAEVTDHTLAQDYPTYGDLVNGLTDLTQLNRAQKEEISTVMERSNQVTAKTASDQNRVSDNNDTEPNNQKLIDE